MKFKTQNGREVNINVSKYLIDWDAPEKSYRSKFQYRVTQFFRPYWQNSICLTELKLPSARLFVDLMNASTKVAVEISGEQHRSFQKGGFFHKNRMDFLSGIKRDTLKQQILELNNYTLIEIYPEDEKNLSPKWIKDNFDIDLI